METILILDFGSQYTHLIKTRLAEIGFLSMIEPADISIKEFQSKNKQCVVKGIILSGGAQSVNHSKIPVEEAWFRLNVPILGICYGHQFIAKKFGGIIEAKGKQFGKQTLTCLKSSVLFKGVEKESNIWMSHNDSVISVPDRFYTTASSDGFCAAMESPDKQIFTVQFHPEVSHTEFGGIILENFATGICKIKKSNPWSPEEFVNQATSLYANKIKGAKILCGLSGGVDSMTMVAMLRRILQKNQLIAVYIDSGLMPKNTKSEVEDFCRAYDINLITKSSSQIFFKNLKNVIDPSEKGKIIGRVFVREFEKLCKKCGATFFAQGTIWSDVVESGVTKFSSQIKPHHNVAGLPEKLGFALIEPLRELFKDQVRELAKYLKLPDSIVHKKVFPGPGFAIRVQGEVTPEKVELVRKSTEIIENQINSSEIKNDIWMGFAILINVPSLGVKGDARVENKQAIVIRVVESKNSMTANFSEKIFPYLGKISDMIIKETGVGRVVYDVTNKPPATIEWQ